MPTSRNARGVDEIAYLYFGEASKSFSGIPKNLDDCFAQLKNLLNPEDADRMKNGT